MKPWLGSSSLLRNWLKSGFVAPGDDLASSSSCAGNSYSVGVLFASGVTLTGTLKIIVIMMMTCNDSVDFGNRPFYSFELSCLASE